MPKTLRQRLVRAERRQRLAALALVAPLVLFLLVTFVGPIAMLLARSVQDDTIATVLPTTARGLKTWSGAGVPDESVYAALAADLRAARAAGRIGRAATRLGFEHSGLRSLVMDTGKALPASAPSWRETLVAIDSRWSERDTWVTLARLAHVYTATYYAAALDHRFDSDGRIVAVAEQERIYVMLFLRTLRIAATVTLLCLMLGYPAAWLLASLPARYANLLMICVLLPFWTSLLVRTTAWMVLLQSHGVVNDLLVFMGLVGDKDRLELMYNERATLIAMTHVLLPFMVLPLYSVMKTVPITYLRAARSLGANGWTAFRRIYLPLTLPGVGAGSLLVFILALGYYITPALVGGRTGQLISNLIAFHMQSSLNWGLAAALGSLLLAGVLLLYWVYSRLFGMDRLRFS